MNRIPSSLAASLMGSAVLAGCLSPADPLPVRSFTPVLSDADAVASTGAVLSLAPVGASGMVQERFAWRLSAAELAFDELNRWADHPRVFTERALRAHWFGSGAFAEVRTARGEEWSVSVDVERFEVSRTGSEGTAEVALRIRADRRGVVETVVRARARGEASPPGLAAAMGQALDEAARLGLEWLRAQVAEG